MRPISFQDYHSFLIRFWFSPDDQSWHGLIEDIQTNESREVQEFTHVIAFLVQQAGEIPLLKEPPADSD